MLLRRPKSMPDEACHMLAFGSGWQSVARAKGFRCL